MMYKKLLIATAATIAAATLLALTPASILAGSYRVYSCKLPDGRNAPTDGWFSTGAAPYGYYDNRCLGGGPISVVLGGVTQTAGSSQIGWGFSTGGARILDYTIYRSGTATAGGMNTSGLLYSARQLNDPGGARGVDYCATYVGCTRVGDPAAGVSSVNRLRQTSAEFPSDVDAWFITISCGGVPGWSCSPTAGNATHASAQVHAAAFTLADDEAPSVGPATGSLASASVLGADTAIRFEARDEGAGIYRAAIEMGGREVVAQTPNLNAGRCQRVGLAGAINDFRHIKPCPKQQTISLRLPLAVVLPGEHQLGVRVYDAAGNVTTVLGPRKVTRLSKTAVSAASKITAHFEPASRRLTTSYGRRRTISGRLLSGSGAPLAARSIEVHERLRRAGAMQRRTMTVVTDSNGRYSYRPSATASRTIELVHAESGATAATALTVRSRMQLRAYRSRIRPYGRLLLRGKLRSQRSSRRITVEIQVRSGRRWRTIGTRRARAGRVFKFRYRLRRTAKGSLRFRARTRRSSDLAVDPLPSRSVRVRVG